MQQQRQTGSSSKDPALTDEHHRSLYTLLRSGFTRE